MSRLPVRFAAVLLAVLVAQPGTAAQPPKAAPAPTPVQIVDAKLVKDNLLVEVTEQVPVEKTVTVQVLKNGVVVTETRKVLVYESVVVQKLLDLSQAKATDATGKPIGAAKLAELLKETTSIVIANGPIADRRRKLFKDSVVFIEFPPAVAAPVGPGPVPPKVLPVPVKE